MLCIVKTVFKILIISWILLGPNVIPAAEMGIVKPYKLNVRSGPDRKAPIIKVLKKDARVRILKRLDGWLEIYHDGQTGYIRNRERYVKIIDEKTKTATGLTPDRSSDAVKIESEKIKQEIEKRKQDVRVFTQEEATLFNGLNEIDLSLDQARKRHSNIQSELTALEGQIKETTTTVKSLLKNIEISEAYVSDRLVALYKMNWMGSVQILASSDSMYDFFIRKSALERILDHDDIVRNRLLEKKALHTKLMDRLQTQRADKVVLDKKSTHQIEYMSKERAKRKKLLAAIQSKRSLELAAIESLKQAAIALDKTITTLGKAQHSPRLMKKPLQKDFIALKGSLAMPVNGNIVSRYGPYQNTKFNLKGFRSGIFIRADRGDPIHAVYGGKIIYSSWFKGYGNMIIIDHGNSYYTVYAHAEELFKSKGDVVDNLEVIATVGDTGSMIGPRLYFEVRHHGKSLDPVKWLKKG